MSYEHGSNFCGKPNLSSNKYKYWKVVTFLHLALVSLQLCIPKYGHFDTFPWLRFTYKGYTYYQSLLLIACYMSYGTNINQDIVQIKEYLFTIKPKSEWSISGSLVLRGLMDIYVIIFNVAW